MEHLEGILDLVERELESIHKAGTFRSRDDIHTVGELVDIVKDIHCIWEYEEDEDGESYADAPYRGGVSYARGRRGNVKRDSMGRYSKRGYSRDGGKSEYINKLRDMMDNAPDEQTRQSIHRMIKDMESM